MRTGEQGCQRTGHLRHRQTYPLVSRKGVSVHAEKDNIDRCQNKDGGNPGIPLGRPTDIDLLVRPLVKQETKNGCGDHQIHRGVLGGHYAKVTDDRMLRTTHILQLRRSHNDGVRGHPHGETNDQQ